jgi:mono/diheme cytochrome c family protein
VFRWGYDTPWLTPDPNRRTEELSLEQFLTGFEAMPAGVIPTPGTSFFAPVQVPDLIGVKDRRFLEHTGYARHRDIADLMRYVASVQGGAAGQAGGHPVGPHLPEPAHGQELMRYSDAQLYAVALYLNALKPPANPNLPKTPERERLVRRGEELFGARGCAACHEPPLYTNNKLTPADGYAVPADHPEREHILPESVHTEPTLALATRKGTGLYTVPSLRGVWYRGPFGHGGRCATLEDWFDPRRLCDDYVPTGYKEAGAR